MENTHRIVTTGRHDQTGPNHSGTRRSTWKPWTIEDAIARLDAKAAR